MSVLRLSKIRSIRPLNTGWWQESVTGHYWSMAWCVIISQLSKGKREEASGEQQLSSCRKLGSLHNSANNESSNDKQRDESSGVRIACRFGFQRRAR
jgi:hypothetical protein